MTCSVLLNRYCLTVLRESSDTIVASPSCSSLVKPASQHGSHSLDPVVKRPLRECITSIAQQFNTSASRFITEAGTASPCRSVPPPAPVFAWVSSRCARHRGAPNDPCITRRPCCDGCAAHAGAARRYGRRSSEGTRGRSAARCSQPAPSSPAPPARRATRGAPSKPRTCEPLRAACCGSSHVLVGDRAGACMHADSLVSVTLVAGPAGCAVYRGRRKPEF